MSALLVLGLFSACGKKDATQPPQQNNDGDLLMGQEMTLSEQHFGDLKSIADQAESGSLSSFKNGAGFAACAMVTHDQNLKKITVDFGTTNCLCKDMRLRRGKLEITYTKTYWDSGNVVTITPVNYFVNEYGLSGTHSLTNMGTDANSNPYWAVTVQGTITKPNNGGTVGWSSSRTLTWAEGSSTPLNWLDDAWQVDGTATLTTSSNVVYTLYVQKSLYRKTICPYISEGMLEISSTGIIPRVIDYGNGDCDNDATLTIGTLVIPFKM